MAKERQADRSDQAELRSLRGRVDQLEQLNTKLEASEERLQILFEHAPDGYYLSDLKGAFVDGNAAAEQITGYKRGELIGSSFLKLKLLSAKDLPRAVSLLAKNVLGRSTGPDELTLIRKNGTPVLVEIRTHPVQVGNRHLVLGIARDISARKKTAHKLEERVKELRTLYALAEIAERKDISPDELYQELTNILPRGWQHEEIACARIVMGDREFHTANFSESPWQQSAPVRVHGAVIGVIEVIYPDERPEEDEGPFLKGERLLINALAERVGRITERIQAEAALEESEERFRDLIEHAHDLIQSVDPDGHFQYVNNAWLKTLGYKESEIDHLTLLDILHPDSREHCMQVFQSVLAGKAVDHVEAEFISKGGARIPVEGSVTCRFKDGRPFSTRAIFRDVSERIQYEAELTRMARRDPLTGALNRYALDELLEQEAKRSGRYAHSIGLLMIDVNRFKEINDRFGHAMGDKVLQAMADLIQSSLRDADILVRYGGDEFLVILLETTGETELVKDRIQADVARRNETSSLLEFPITLAIGSYHWSSESGRTIEEALAEADKLMYEDKRK